jgi:hypothetical protein
MAAIKGRRHRTGVADAKPFRMSLRPALRAKADRTTTALGISLAAYLDELVARDRTDETGRPDWWADPVPGDQGDQEELPLSKSA